MPQKFFTNTIESKFIKNLLLNTPLPLQKTVSSGDKVIKGEVYIYHNNIIRCDRTGFIYGEDHSELFANNDVFVSENLMVDDEGMIAKYTVLQPFYFGNNYPKLTSIYRSPYGYYDTYTHEVLGNYLRCLRDISGIDLMPFYNCFSYRVISNLHISQSGYVEEANESFKVFAVPVRFDKKYTIAVDCSSVVRIMPVFYSNFGLMRDRSGGNFTDKLKIGVSEYNGASFKSPIVYSVNTDSIEEKDLTELMSVEKKLYLLIQLPENNDSSIVVIEGDNSDRRCNVIFDVSSIDKMDDSSINRCLLSQISLLQINDRSIYAFSDRLIEYLLLNVIDNGDEISNNIRTVQNKIGILSNKLVVPGVWDRITRNELYRQYMNSRGNRKIDITGFVDKDIEDFVNRR